MHTIFGALKINIPRTRDWTIRLDIIVCSLNLCGVTARTIDTSKQKMFWTFTYCERHNSTLNLQKTVIYLFSNHSSIKNIKNEWHALSIKKIHYVFKKVLRFSLLIHFHLMTKLRLREKHTKYSTYYFYFILRFNFSCCNKSKNNVLSSKTPSENLSFLRTPSIGIRNCRWSNAVKPFIVIKWSCFCRLNDSYRLTVYGAPQLADLT